MTLLLTILAILPIDSAVREHFDQIEIQDVFGWSAKELENGDTTHELKFTFTQILFRNWNDHTGTHEIEAWKMCKPPLTPHYSHARGLWEIRFFDGDTERIITTRSLVETSSDFDSEVTERASYPKENRRDLRRMRVGK